MTKTACDGGYSFISNVSSYLDIVAIWNPEQHVRKASHHGSKQQQRSCVAISLIV